jgi:uncharacterized protein with von Willebrand factor type A (vWA) domain
MESEKKAGIQITHQADKQEIAIINGGIKILASEKPISGSFAVEWGHVYVVIDCSGSMKGSKLDQARIGICEFAIDAFRKEYLVGLINFNTSAEHLCGPVHDIDIIRDKMKGLRASGGTNMTAAIKIAHAELKNFSGPKAMVIATDGIADDVKSSLAAADRAKADKIEILTIGTDDADEGFLVKLASRNGLSTKVSSEVFGQAITSASLLLMSPRSLMPK